MMSAVPGVPASTSPRLAQIAWRECEIDRRRHPGARVRIDQPSLQLVVPISWDDKTQAHPGTATHRAPRAAPPPALLALAPL